MAWTTPRTWTIGELVIEDFLNQQIRDNMLLLKTSIDNNGKIVAISSTYFASLDGSNITGVVKTALANDFTVGIQNFNGGSTTRIVIPVGVDKWAT
jgi:hypothetical protein